MDFAIKYFASHAGSVDIFTSQIRNDNDYQIQCNVYQIDDKDLDLVTTWLGKRPLGRVFWREINEDIFKCFEPHWLLLYIGSNVVHHIFSQL